MIQGKESNKRFYPAEETIWKNSSLCRAAKLQIHQGVTDPWWSSSHDWSHEMDGYKLHKTDRAGDRGLNLHKETA